MKKTAKELLSKGAQILQNAEGSLLSPQTSSSSPRLSLSHRTKNQHHHSKTIQPNVVKPTAVQLTEPHIISFPQAPLQKTTGFKPESGLPRALSGEIAPESTLAAPHPHKREQEQPEREQAATSNEPHHRCGPFQLHLESEISPSNEQLGKLSHPDPLTPLVRSYDCKQYDCCLELAAALNWENFTCAGCGGEINQHLIWKANLARREDAVAKRLCKKTRIRLA